GSGGRHVAGRDRHRHRDFGAGPAARGDQRRACGDAVLSRYRDGGIARRRCARDPIGTIARRAAAGAPPVAHVLCPLHRRGILLLDPGPRREGAAGAADDAGDADVASFARVRRDVLLAVASPQPARAPFCNAFVIRFGTEINAESRNRPEKRPDFRRARPGVLFALHSRVWWALALVPSTP